MNPILLKSLLGIALAGGVSAVAYGSYGLFSEKTIKDKLVEEKLDPLDVSRPEEATDEEINGTWGKLIEKISTESQEPKKIIELVTPTSGEDNNNKKENIKNLKKKCKDLFEEKYSNNENYENAKNWCTSKSPKITIPDS